MINFKWRGGDFEGMEELDCLQEGSGASGVGFWV